MILPIILAKRDHGQILLMDFSKAFDKLSHQHLFPAFNYEPH